LLSSGALDDATQTSDPIQAQLDALGTGGGVDDELKKLKAELKIAETQAKDVQDFQTAEVDTHNGVVPGHVIRIDPAVHDAMARWADDELRSLEAIKRLHEGGVV